MAQYWNIEISYLSITADTLRIAHTFAATAKLNFVSVQFILDKCTLLFDMNFTHVWHFHIFLAQKSVIASIYIQKTMVIIEIWMYHESPRRQFVQTNWIINFIFELFFELVSLYDRSKFSIYFMLSYTQYMRAWHKTVF